MNPEDYDLISEHGYEQWFGGFIEHHLAEFAAPARALAEETPRATAEFEKRGYAVFAPAATTTPYEFFCGGRSIREFVLDLHRIPDRVQAAMDAAMPAIKDEARAALARQPMAMWVGGWRSASEFLSPRLWERFVFPYVKELVELVVDEGVIPVLHFDSNWTRDLDRFKELPRAKCVLALDGMTDIFRAKAVLGDHMCLLGDVSPRMLCLGTPAEVHEYSTRLVREIGPAGFILAQGCAIPPDAKLENVRAMVGAVRG
jgi:uroporphyrinogen-III decarboxylase